MANIITLSRVVFSILLLFFTPFSPLFLLFYILGGISDMVDGMVARRKKSASTFGSRLDSVADLVFISVCLYVLLPNINIPTWALIWTALIALVKASTILSGIIMKKKELLLHSAANKITGLLLFLFPLTVPYIDIRIPLFIILPLATFASIEEGHKVRTGEERSKE